MSGSTEMTLEGLEAMVLDSKELALLEECNEAAKELNALAEKYPKLFFCCAIGCPAGFNTTIGGYGSARMAMSMLSRLGEEIFSNMVKEGDNDEKGEC